MFYDVLRMMEQLTEEVFMSMRLFKKVKHTFKKKGQNYLMYNDQVVVVVY